MLLAQGQNDKKQRLIFQKLEGQVIESPELNNMSAKLTEIEIDSLQRLLNDESALGSLKKLLYKHAYSEDFILEIDRSLSTTEIGLRTIAKKEAITLLENGFAELLELKKVEESENKGGNPAR